MAEQRHTQKMGRDQGDRVPLSDPGPATLPPVEGRTDIAENLEEQQRYAYSAHRTTTSQRKATLKHQRAGEFQGAPTFPTDPGAGTLPPVEGRPDVAENLEEEQSRAYSAHHSIPFS